MILGLDFQKKIIIYRYLFLYYMMKYTIFGIIVFAAIAFISWILWKLWDYTYMSYLLNAVILSRVIAIEMKLDEDHRK